MLAAVPLKCLGGELQGKLLPQNDEEMKQCSQMGVDVTKVLLMDDLVKGDDAIFAATVVTDGELLKGVQFKGSLGTTYSLVMHAKSGTVRFIDGTHSLKKKPNLVIK